MYSSKCDDEASNCHYEDDDDKDNDDFVTRIMTMKID